MFPSNAKGPVLLVPSINLIPKPGTTSKSGGQPRPRNMGPRRPKIIPFSRPGMAPLDPNDELSAKMGGLQLEKNFQIYPTFDSMGLKPALSQGIAAYGLENPAFIQQRAIIPCIKGRDVIVQAQSGMGKTATLAIALLERIDVTNPQCQGLVIAPTRELAEQITDVFSHLSKRMAGVTIFSCVGGRNTRSCKTNVAKGRNIIIGTPGRLLHMMEIVYPDGQRLFTLDSIKTLALDEADKMLNGEFNRDITQILGLIPTKAQIILMSATMPEHSLRVTTRFMHNPLKFLINEKELTLQGIRQYYLDVDKEEFKLITLSDIYNLISKAWGMIFCNSRSKVDQISKQMRGLGHTVSAMRGMLDQSERDQILKDFRSGVGANRMVITSDVLARGIDVQQVNLVVNYDFPIKKEDYIHRVGRGGRYGRHGVAITFVTQKDLPGLKVLQEFYNTEILPMPPVSSLASLLNLQ